LVFAGNEIAADSSSVRGDLSGGINIGKDPELLFSQGMSIIAKGGGICGLASKLSVIGQCGTVAGIGITAASIGISIYQKDYRGAIGTAGSFAGGFGGAELGGDSRRSPSDGSNWCWPSARSVHYSWLYLFGRISWWQCGRDSCDRSI